LNVIEIGD